MKKTFTKYLILLCIFFVCLPNIFSEEENIGDFKSWDIKCDEAKKDGTKNGCWETMEFCFDDGTKKSYTGCVYDENNPDFSTTRLNVTDKPKYNESLTVRVPDPRDTNNEGWKIEEKMTKERWEDQLYYDGSPNDAVARVHGMTFRIYNNIPKEKVYAAIDQDDKVTTVVCYRGFAHVRENHKAGNVYGVFNDPFETIGFDITPKECDPDTDQDCMGATLIFKMFKPSKNGTCSMSMARMILPISFTDDKANESWNLLKTSVAKNDDLKNPHILELRGKQKGYPSNGLLINADGIINAASAFSETGRLGSDFTTIGEINAGSSAFNSSDQKNIYAGIGVNESARLLKDYGEDSHCPEYFLVNPNVKELNNRYRVSNKLDDNKYDMDLGKKINNVFTGNYENGTSYKGCSEEDEDGKEKMLAKAEEEVKKIKSKTCPNDGDFVTFVKNINADHKTIVEEFKKLYSVRLQKKYGEEIDKLLTNAVNEKIDECYYTVCNFTKEEKEAVKKELAKEENKDCKDRCRITSKFEYSDSPNAQCWYCGSGNSGYYTWTVSTGTSCHPEGRAKEDCYGTPADQRCVKCLKNVYTKLKISEDKIKCMNDNFGLLEKAKNDANDEIHEQTEELIKEASKYNAERASDTYTHYNIGLNGNGFGSDGDDCKSFLGENISKIVKASFTILRIAGAIIAIVNAMMSLIPAVVSKNADALKKASKKCVTMGIVLAIIGILPSIIILIARLFGYDVSCLM